MLNIKTLSADQILSISAPEKLFNQKTYKTDLQRLQSVWHPDRNLDPKANDVFVHITTLGKLAKEKIANDNWDGNAVITFMSDENRQYRFRYKKMHKFELGKLYIGSEKVMYVLSDSYVDLYENGISSIENIKYLNGGNKKEFTNQFPFPDLVATYRSDIGYIVILNKPKNVVLLQDLIDHQPNKQIDPKHVAWIIGSLYNITTFLDCVGICHNSIMSTTVFVDPENHSVFLLGGWWYSTKTNTKLKAIPRELVKILPKNIFTDKTSLTKYDRMAVKGVAICCLGDPTLVGSKLLTNKDLPKPFLNWIRMSSTLSAIDEFVGWDKAMEQSYGKRKFIKFDFNINDVY